MPRRVRQIGRGASREAGLTPRIGSGNVVRVAPARPGRAEWVCVRSLRTQQCTDSQCQCFTLSAVWLSSPSDGFLWYIFTRVVQLVFVDQ